MTRQFDEIMLWYTMRSKLLSTFKERMEECNLSPSHQRCGIATTT